MYCTTNLPSGSTHLRIADTLNIRIYPKKINTTRYEFRASCCINILLIITNYPTMTDAELIGYIKPNIVAVADITAATRHVFMTENL